MLNATDIAAIESAIWNHPQGVSFLAKIAQIESLSISCGNPCCVKFIYRLWRRRR